MLKLIRNFIHKCILQSIAHLKIDLVKFQIQHVNKEKIKTAKEETTTNQSTESTKQNDNSRRKEEKLNRSKSIYNKTSNVYVLFRRKTVTFYPVDALMVTLVNKSSKVVK